MQLVFMQEGLAQVNLLGRSLRQRCRIALLKIALAEGGSKRRRIRRVGISRGIRSRIRNIIRMLEIIPPSRRKRQPIPREDG
jgi:hypothetical protein